MESLSVLATASVTACVAAGFLLVTCPSLAPVPMIVVPAVGVGGTIYAREARQLSKVKCGPKENHRSDLSRSRKFTCLPEQKTDET